MRIYSNGRVEIRSALLVEDYITSRKSPTEGGFLLADAQHGLKRVGNNDVRLFTPDGNVLLQGQMVGVGTSYPSAKLEVRSSSASEHPLKAYGISGYGMSVEGNGRVVIRSSVTGADNNVASYPLYVAGRDQGIAIKINANADSSHNYVTFLDYYGTAGRIEGQNVDDYVNDPTTIAWYVYMGLVDVAEGIAIGAAIIDPSGVVGLGAQVAYNHFFEAWTMSHLGVTFTSGGADYAEWLPRLDEYEVISPGDIVGVIGGRVSKRTEGTHHVLPVSLNPIVLGNMPLEGEEQLCEKVAFLGQAPVKVIGPVKEGDYIVPSGFEDGSGTAVSPEQMAAADFGKVVGRAWEGSDSEYVKYVNCSIGLGPGDVAAVLGKQQDELGALREELAAKESEIRELHAQMTSMDRELGAVGEIREAVERLEARLAEREGPVQAKAAGSTEGEEPVVPVASAGR
jgi:hypothetical protein